MKARLPRPHDALLRWLVEHLLETSQWREAKAREYPDDVRNGNSAMALCRAVDLLEASDEDELPPAFHWTAALGELLGGGVAWWDSFPWGPYASRAASRFGFDRQEVDVDAAAVAQLLKDIYRGMLEDEVELIGDYSDEELREPHRQELVRLLRREGLNPRVPLLDTDDPLVRLLVELRDLLNERLPA